MINEFLNYLANEKRFSEHTVVAYKKDIEQFLESALPKSKVNKFLHKDVRNYMVELVEDGKENSTINRKLAEIVDTDNVCFMNEFLRPGCNCVQIYTVYFE